VADVVWIEESARETNTFEIRHAAYEIRQRTRVQMAVRNGRGLIVDMRIDMSKGGNLHDIVTDIRKEKRRSQGFSMFMIKKTPSQKRD